MKASLRRLMLTAHIASSVGAMGAVAAFLALALVGLGGGEPQAAASAYQAMEVIAWVVILPLVVASLITGLVQSLGSEWGVFRHYWVVAKLGINVLAAGILLLHMRPIGILARAAESHASIDGNLSKVQVQLAVNAAAAILVLMVATALSIYKPRGLTPFGARIGRGGAAVVNATPTWVKAVGLVIACTVLTIVILHLTGRGLGSH